MFNTYLRIVLTHFTGTVMNSKNKGLDSVCGTQSKFMGSQSLHNNFVEVSDESCHKQEYSILCYDEQFSQSVPDKNTSTGENGSAIRLATTTSISQVFCMDITV